MQTTLCNTAVTPANCPKQIVEATNCKLKHQKSWLFYKPRAIIVVSSEKNESSLYLYDKSNKEIIQTICTQ